MLSEGLAVEEGDGASVEEEVGRGGDVLSVAMSDSGGVTSWLQLLWSSAGGSTSHVAADDGLRAASKESPLTAGKTNTMVVLTCSSRDFSV